MTEVHVRCHRPPWPEFGRVVDDRCIHTGRPLVGAPVSREIRIDELSVDLQVDR